MVRHSIVENVNLIGWNVEPHRLVEIFKHVFLPRPDRVTIHVYEPLTDINRQELGKVVLEEGMHNIFIIFSAEGHSEQEYDLLLYLLKNHQQFQFLDNKNIILYTAAFELSTDEYEHVQNWSGILNNTLYGSGGIIDYPHTNKYFTFLNRQPRWERQRLLEKLYEMDMLPFMNVSYLNIPLETKYRSLYPLVFDKPNVSFDDGYNLIGTDSLFNIVAESSFDNVQDLISIEVPGISEKTYKTILGQQVPVFLSSHKTVHYYRLMGFDPFDDIVDHSYDSIKDPVKRIEEVAKEVQRLKIAHRQKSLHNIRMNLDSRFKENFELMKWYSDPKSEFLTWHNKFLHLGLL